MAVARQRLRGWHAHGTRVAGGMTAHRNVDLTAHAAFDILVLALRMMWPSSSTTRSHFTLVRGPFSPPAARVWYVVTTMSCLASPARIKAHQSG